MLSDELNAGGRAHAKIAKAPRITLDELHDPHATGQWHPVDTTARTTDQVPQEQEKDEDGPLLLLLCCD